MNPQGRRSLWFALIAAALAAVVAALLFSQLNSPIADIPSVGNGTSNKEKQPQRTVGRPPANAAQSVAPLPAAKQDPPEEAPESDAAPVVKAPGIEGSFNVDERTRSLQGTERAEAQEAGRPMARKPGEH